MCELLFFFSWLLLHLRLFARPSSKRCPFRWQCPVSSHTIHCGWFLFNLNSSLVLSQRVPILVSACPRKKSQCFTWPLIVQSLNDFSATPKLPTYFSFLRLLYYLDKFAFIHLYLWSALKAVDSILCTMVLPQLSKGIITPSSLSLCVWSKIF
jgi:hypothetical protein